MSRRGRRTNSVRDERWLLGIVMSLVLVIGILAIWFSIVDKSGPTVLGADTDLRLPLADLETGELHLFSYPIDSSTGAEFVVQQGKDGILRVAFASCQRCYGSRHYEWRGQLVCGHCGHAMNLPAPREKPTEPTGCIPVALPYSIEGDQLVVRGQAIMDGFHRLYQRDTETN